MVLKKKNKRNLKERVMNKLQVPCVKNLCHLTELVGLRREEYSIIILPRLHSSKLPQSSHFENVIFGNSNVYSIWKNFFPIIFCKRTQLVNIQNKNMALVVIKLFDTGCSFKTFKICYKFCT